METQTMSRIPNIITQKHQHGAVLVVSLMVLLVLTLLGISSLDGSIMEEKMAANAQTANTTFQEAESAIRKTFRAEGLFNEEHRSAAVSKAHNDTAAARHRDHLTGASLTSSTELAYASEGRCYNCSDGFAMHNIEIIGTANVGAITNTITQGYRVGPLPRIDKPN
jgi:Tfp pilus assembly protein PilX